MTSQNPLAYLGINSNDNPPFIKADRAPTSNDLQDPGTRWQDSSVSPAIIYQTTGAGVWDAGGNAYATTTAAGIVELGTAGEMTTGTSETLVPPIKVVKDYVDGVAIAGAPAWSESVSGIGQLSTSAEATTGTNDNTAMTPLKVAAVLAAPPAIGSGTPAAGSFSTLGATGAVDFDAGGSWESGGAAIDIGADASADAINLGTGAAARVVTIGNVTGASQVVLNAGTAGIALASTGAGDITINSDDTLLLDADGVLELNSSAGVIGIGNDADAFDINIGTGAAARVVTVGNNTGATQLVLEAGSGGLDIGTAASAQSVTIGNVTGASAISMLVGTGNFSLDGVAGSTYNIGASTTTGSVTIGGTAQTGDLVLGSSSGTNAVKIANGAGASTVSIAAVQVAGAVNIGTAMTTGTITVGGTGLQTGTVSIAPGTGAQTVNIATGGTGIKTVNIATGAVANVVSIGSASAGAIAVDTAAGISMGAATASDFSVSGATEDLTLQSSAGRVIVKGEEAAVSAVELVSAAGGISASSALQLSLISSEAAVADSVRIQASAADGGIDVDAGTGGIAIDSTGAISLQGAAASDFSVSGAGVDLDLASAAGRIIATAGEDAADAIYLHADAGTSEKIRIHSDQGTAADSVELESDVGGITLTSGLASADAINLSASAGGVDIDGALQVNVASSQAAASAIVINASDAAGGIDLTTGGGSIDLSSSGFVTMAPAVSSVAGNGLTINATVGSATFTGQTTAAGAQATFTITNSQVAATSALFVTVTNVGSNDARMTLEQVKPAAGSFEVMTQNNGAAALNGDVIINFWVIAP